MSRPAGLGSPLALAVLVVILSGCGRPTESAVIDEDLAFSSGDDYLGTGAGDPLCRNERNWTPTGDVSADYVDFVQLPSGSFVNTEQNAGVLDRPDLGSVVAEVCLELSAVTFTETFDIKIDTEVGDAAYLEPGTKLREIVGADPALRLGTVVGGRVLIYELLNPSDAVVGGQVIDLGTNIDEVTVNRADGETVIASIAEPAALESLVAAVRSASVDRSPRPEPAAGQPDYVLEFHRSDGTTSRRRYRPATGELASIIVVPEKVRLLLAGLIAAADPDAAMVGTATSATTATTTTAAAPQGDSTTAVANPDTGLISEPSNEAESTLRFDFGAIVGTATAGDITWIQFDRYQMGDGANGPDLVEEIRIEGATDLLWANENPRFRWYRLAADVEVLELEAGWFNRLCDGEPAGVEFMASSLNRLLALDARLVSVTLVDREVVRIRDQRSC